MNVIYVKRLTKHPLNSLTKGRIYKVVKELSDTAGVFAYRIINDDGNYFEFDIDSINFKILKYKDTNV